MTRNLVAAVAILALALGADFARAEGAVAVAEPPDVSADGYSSGISYNYETSEQAEARALEECRNSPDAPPRTKRLCKIVSNFRDRCVAVALDPQSGTPGAGWAVAETSALAKRDALRTCEDTAGRDRKGECRVTADACDGRAEGRN